MEIRESIGGRIREERQRLGISQAALAELGGGKARTAIDREKGVSTPNAETMAAWATAGLDVMYVLTGARAALVEGDLDPLELRLVDNLRRIPLAGREKLCLLVEGFVDVLEAQSGGKPRRVG